MIESGKNTEILITKRVDTLQHYPYSQCTDLNSFSSPVYDEMKKQDIVYDKLLCNIYSVQYEIIRKFKCYDMNLPKMFDNIEPCRNRSQYERFFTEINSSVSLTLSNCPIDCELPYYQYQLSSSEFPTQNWLKLGQNFNRPYFERIFGRNIFNKNATSLNKAVEASFASLSISFAQMGVIELNEQPTTLLVNLFSDIGGTMGLFVGPSLLTFTEVFDLIFTFVAIWLAKRKSTGQVHIKQEDDKIKNDVPTILI